MSEEDTCQQQCRLHTSSQEKLQRQRNDVIDRLGDSSLPGSNRSSSGGTSSTPSPGDKEYTTPEIANTLVSDSIYKSPSTCDTRVTPTDEQQKSCPPSELLGKMSVHKDADRYNMEHKNRGKCIIFNHENFNTSFETREGSTIDAHRIKQTFQRLGFSVEICDDYEHSSVINKINELSAEDHSDNDCICIFVLTHGMKNDLICAKDVAYPLESLWQPFTAEKCSTLAGKPKLFFIQACRGDNLDPGIKLSRTTETDSATTSYRIPTHADFLFAHSTFPGFYSWRNKETGTIFMQSLCDVIDEHAWTTELRCMVTKAMRTVATKFDSHDPMKPWLHRKRQMPCQTSTLIRNLYFTPKND